MKKTSIDKLNAIVSDETSNWLEKAEWRKENRDWLDKSAKIAFRILREIRSQKETNGMTQKVLAEKLNVSPQYINKIVKGQENLSLDTIGKIEKALGIVLIEIPSFQSVQEISMASLFQNTVINRNTAKEIATSKMAYNKDGYINQSETGGIAA